MRPALPLMTVPSGSSQCLISSTTPSPAAGTPPPSLDLAPLPFTLFLILHSRPRRRALTFQPLSASYSLSLSLSRSLALSLSLSSLRFSQLMHSSALPVGNVCLDGRGGGSSPLQARGGWVESWRGWLRGELEGWMALATSGPGWLGGGLDAARIFGASPLRPLLPCFSSPSFTLLQLFTAAPIHCFPPIHSPLSFSSYQSLPWSQISPAPIKILLPFTFYPFVPPAPSNPLLPFTVVVGLCWAWGSYASLLFDPAKVPLPPPPPPLPVPPPRSAFPVPSPRPAFSCPPLPLPVPPPSSCFPPPAPPLPVSFPRPVFASQPPWWQHACRQRGPSQELVSTSNPITEKRDAPCTLT